LPYTWRDFHFSVKENYLKVICLRVIPRADPGVPPLPPKIGKKYDFLA
jgi:hypothetical protein